MYLIGKAMCDQGRVFVLVLFAWFLLLCERTVMSKTYSKIIAYTYLHFQELNLYVKLTHKKYKLGETRPST